MPPPLGCSAIRKKHSQAQTIQEQMNYSVHQVRIEDNRRNRARGRWLGKILGCSFAYFSVL
jgi:hypothetical protein